MKIAKTSIENQKKANEEVVSKSIKQQKKEETIKREMVRQQYAAIKRETDFEKNRVALERLQLNWIKWNITCIALGFTVYKFYYARVHEEHLPAAYHVTGRDLGIFLISLGLISLIAATIQHRKSTVKLKTQYEQMHPSLTLILSYVVMCFSMIVLLIVIFRS